MRRIALLGALVVASAAVASNIRAQVTPTTPLSLYQDLSWRCVGPFDGGPVASVEGLAGEAGVYVITTPSGGAWKTTDGGDTWASIERRRTSAAPAVTNQWVDPANQRRVVKTDEQGIAVSLDAGATWVTSHHLPIAEVPHVMPREHPVETARRRINGVPANVSIVDPARAGLIFAGTSDAVYVSFDAGGHWDPLRLNMPGVVINDLDIHGNDLVAATQGRSVWQLDDISPLRQITATSAVTPVILFKSADVVRAADATATIDYYLGGLSRGDVTLEILDAAGRVVHAATSAATDLADRWLPVTRALSSAPGHHRVVWPLRLDPPPAPQHRFAQMARAMFEDMPPDVAGPRVLPGAYRVTLTAGGRSYTQPLVVRSHSSDTPSTLVAERAQFDLAMKIYDAMRIAHREFEKLARVRAQLAPMLTSTDEDLAARVADLNTRLVTLDGSDWTGLVVPDEDQDDFDLDEAEEQGVKHPDFIPPRPVSVSKDYDDPTSILGRRFASIAHPPALTEVSVALGGILTKTVKGVGAPDAVAVADYQRSCEQLSVVLNAWRAVNAQDVPRMNVDLAKRKLPALPVASTVSTITCGTTAP